MRGINKAIIMGNVGRDPEVKTFGDGTAYTDISVATTEKWRDKKTGEEKTQTEWHRVTAYGKLAEIIGQYVTKGSGIYVEGKIRSRKYEKDGIERTVYEIRADQIELLPSGQKSGGGRPQQQTSAASSAAAESSDEFQDDIPF